MTMSVFVPLLFSAVAAQATTAASQSDARPSVDILTWFKMNPAQFGCYLEKNFGFRDKKWNCGVGAFKPSGDPCKNAGPYYAGPSFPQKLTKKFHQHVANVSLAWEYGALQAISLEFDRHVADADARAWFGLPTQGAPPEFESVDTQECSNKASCLIVQKFEHMGAGEADCGGEGSGD